ncbi:MAG TPA: hypothetical protein VGH22_11520 [Candidatus Binatia bacterium]
MAHNRIALCSLFLRPIWRALAALIVLVLTNTAGTAAKDQTLELQGTIESGGTGLAGYKVSLYASFAAHGPSWKLLGSDSTNSAGNFRIAYSLPPGLLDNQQPILFVEAERGPAMLASAIGTGSSIPEKVVVNERTTVATGNAFAQFVDGWTIRGNTYGMINAVRMAANLADPQTGATGVVLASIPNGTETSTLSRFNSLGNVVAGCVADAENCAKLFEAATPPGGLPPANMLQAIANIVKYPSYPGYPADADDPVFVLSQAQPIYQPALRQRPTDWLLFLKITGGFYRAQDSTNLMNGPGNFAIDEKGFVWVNDNAVPQAVGDFACAGLTLMKFYPWGENFPGSPYTGGGLSGAGYGITVDPDGNVWVGNFGFQDPPCELLPDRAAHHNTVSEFEPDGSPVAAAGYAQGNISWPQGTVSDRKGNIWVANCGNDSVTVIPRGNPGRAFNVPLGPIPPSRDPQMKPFGAVIDGDGNLWVTNIRSNTMSIISPQGELIETLSGMYQGKTVLSHPVGNAADIEGNIWVANSDWLDSPCPTRLQLGTAENPSITLFQGRNRKPYPGSPFTGGGLTLPWGIAVDGDNTVWVFNFGAVKVGSSTTTPTGISRFCGVDTRKCPPGMHVGEPISPDTRLQKRCFGTDNGWSDRSFGKHLADKQLED